MATKESWFSLCLRISLLLLCLNLPVVVNQDSQDISVSNVLHAKVMLPDQNDDESPSESNETSPDENDLDTRFAHENDNDGIEKDGDTEDRVPGVRWEEESVVDFEEGVEHLEELDTEEKAEVEAMAVALDEELPDVIEDTVEETVETPKRYAQIMEVDQTVQRQKMHDGDFHHPFHRPNIVQDIHFTYRRFQKMKLMRHGKFWMGTNDPRSETGEYPVREIPVRSFYLDVYPVINAFYWAFRATKRFVRSEAEVRGWSWVTENVVSQKTKDNYSTEGPRGWLAVKKARWDKPEGPDSDLEDRWTHPVVHLSWYDAKKFCEYYGKRLPTEQEWEYASRAGLVAEEYPWGDRWERRRANTWQGRWPASNSEVDGFKATSPVDAYKPQNNLGLYDLIGNVWEWTHSRYYERLISRELQEQMHVLKGGSFVDSVDGETNLAVRNGQRSGQAPDYTASNVGFRCARSAPEKDPNTKIRKVPKVADTTKRKIPKIYRKPKPTKDEL